MKKGKKSKFKGAVGRNAVKQSQGSVLTHLNMPKGVTVFKETPKSRIDLDIIPYVVTSNVHPDRDEEYGIATPGELWYKRPYWVHRGIGANDEKVVCLSTIKQKCPICEHRQQLMKDGAHWSDDVVKALRPKLRNLYAVIPRNSKDYQEAIHLWDVSQYAFQDTLNEEVQENETFETFPDLEDGFTLRIRFSEESFGSTKFAKTSRIDFNDRKKPLSEKLLDAVPSLDDLLVIQSYKAVAAQFYDGLVDPENEDDDYEEEDAVVNDADNEDADDEDADDEDAAPKRTAPAKKKEAPVKKAKAVCPYGHTFGDDVDDYEDCDECEVWDACMTASS